MRRVNLLGLFLIVMLGSCRSHLSTGVTIDPALRKIVPSDSIALAGVDLDKLRATPFYQRHSSQLDIPLLSGVVEQLGFDPRRDLAEVLVTWNGKEIGLAGRGRVARQDIERRLSSNATRTEYNKHQIWSTGGGNAVAFLSQEVAVGGSRHSVQNAIDNYAGNAGLVPDELAASLSHVTPTDQVWLVSRGNLPFSDVPTRSEYASLLANFAGYIKSTATGITVDSGLHLRAQIDCVSEEGSKRVNDALRGGIGLARLSVKDDQLDLLRLYDAFHVKQEGPSVFLQADLPADLADALLNLKGKL